MRYSTENGEKPPAEQAGESRRRRPYRKPTPEPQGQIKPSLLGSPPPPP